MDTNTVATLYFPQDEGFRRLEVSAFWQEASQLRSSKTAVGSRHPATIFIALADNPQLEGEQITTECYVVRGTCTEVNLKALLKYHNAQQVTSITVFDYAADSTMGHWEIEVE